MAFTSVAAKLATRLGWASGVAELLSVTNWTLPQIAERLNFSHSEYMSVAFKRFMGKSPG